MRKNKRRKKRLKTALILLIILFILAGFGGMLFVSHKNKIEKEQRKEAALAALDSIPEITATPAATATPVPTATPTPSLTPVPTILPAFEPENYQGTWYSEDGLTTIDIYDISLKSVSFTYKRINGKNHSLSVEADVTAEVAGNATQFYLKDSDGNKAKGEFVFDKSGEFYVKVKTYKMGRWFTVLSEDRIDHDKGGCRQKMPDRQNRKMPERKRLLIHQMQRHLPDHPQK